jgi:uncharacterized membrane protein HdeD (DUF308 family)
MRVHTSMPSPILAAAAPFSAGSWLLLLRGSIAVAFGAVALLSPRLPLATLVHLFGVCLLIDGILAICAAIAGDLAGARRWLVFAGWAGIAAGLFTFQWPGLGPLSLLFFMAAWAILIGLVHGVAAIRFEQALGEKLLLAFSGAVALVFGFAATAASGAGASAMVRLIGLYWVVFGLTAVGLALRLWRFAPQEEAVD